MPLTKQVTGPELAIVVDSIGRPYQPGDVVTGRVVRQAHVVSPMAIAEVWLLGRAKVKLGVTRSNGQGAQTTYYRSRFNFFDKASQRIQAGPVHVPPDGPAESWDFAIEIPSQMSPKSVLSEHRDPSRGSFVPLNAEAIYSQSLPSSFVTRGSDWRSSKDFQCYVEYHIEASLALQGSHGKVVTASRPIDVRASPMPYPLASLDLQRQLHVGEVSTFRLVPGMEDVHLSFKQKTQKLFHSSKVPSLGLRVHVDTPATVQLGNPAPVPLQIQVVPDRKRTSDVLHEAPQTALLTSMELILKAKTFVLAIGSIRTYETNDTLKHRISLPCLTIAHVGDATAHDQNPPSYQEKDTVGQHGDTKRRLPTPPRDEKAPMDVTEDKLDAPASFTAEPPTSPGESSASGSSPQGRISRASELRLPINWGRESSNTPLDIGTLMDLRFFHNRIRVLGNQSATTAPEEIHPDFTTFCIRHEHALKWKVWLEIAGEVMAFEGEKPLVVLGPAAES